MPDDPTKKEKEVERLTKIFVDEVSLVDKPANKRQFLVVKRNQNKNLKKGGKEDMPEDEKKVEGATTETPTQKATEEVVFPEGAEVIVLEAQKAEGDTGEGDSKPEETGETQKVEAPTNAMDAIKKAVSTLEDAAKIEGIPEDVKKALEEPITFLSRIKSYGQPPKPSTAPETKETKKSGDDGDEVEKAGRKISQARLSKLKSAGEALVNAAEGISELVKDFEGITDTESKETKKSEEVPADPPASATTTDIKDVVSKAVQDALKPITALTDELKKLDERVGKVEDIRPASKSIEGEGDETKKSETPFWGGLITGDKQ